MIKTALTSLALLLVVSAAPAQPRVPTLDDLLTLKSIGGTQMSPDGKWVAYTVSIWRFQAGCLRDSNLAREQRHRTESAINT